MSLLQGKAAADVGPSTPVPLISNLYSGPSNFSAISPTNEVSSRFLQNQFLIQGLQKSEFAWPPPRPFVSQHQHMVFMLGNRIVAVALYLTFTLPILFWPILRTNWKWENLRKFTWEPMGVWMVEGYIFSWSTIQFGFRFSAIIFSSSSEFNIKTFWEVRIVMLKAN